ncbi:3-phosphoserine/phosphohydroxythreonine transaminase [Azospira restricta]|uniref:Phosphoserine aminotransferase n=1 Tax=Azospira restricta TaxID=404405 RepID=A0A974SLW7_9RHOO|nr:3-phosphoserine/phosphohydroxythreonine transaminase [Azospira restricta]QRJ62140.1 3-phosphoserine/phosphohydroxythreonine transaminase [Azospira restricta]
MSRVWNFSAGPAVLPAEVLEQVKDELLDWHGAGCGVMEMSHRGKEFTSIIEAAEADLRELLGIPANYRVLFLQGGATQQFAQIPINLLPAGKSADYLVTGSWSKKAVKEAQRVVAGTANVRVAGSTEASGFTRFLDAGEIDLDPNAAYLHLCTNETIHGVEIDCARLPATAVPIVADLSSHILSRPVDVSKYALIYAGAQKNVGPSGVTLVIVREDLLGRAPATIPTVMDYAVMAENGSMLNTPPTFAIYVSGLVFQWLKRQGGLAEMEKINAHKAELLYACIDGSEGFYRNPVRVADRSRMNVPFTLARSELDADFLAEAKAAGLVSLKGHKSVGGMRASIYNAMPTDGVRELVAFMDDFRKRKA